MGTPAKPLPAKILNMPITPQIFSSPCVTPLLAPHLPPIPRRSAVCFHCRSACVSWDAFTSVVSWERRKSRLWGPEHWAPALSCHSPGERCNRLCLGVFISHTPTSSQLLGWSGGHVLPTNLTVVLETLLLYLCQGLG